jgi:ACT domain-containing protein
MAEKKESQICIITVTGKDKVGIIARLSTAMTKANINIIDVNQNIMEDFFVMTMACDMAAATVNMKQIQTKISRIATDMELNITFQHEKIFKAMHRV